MKKYKIAGRGKAHDNRVLTWAFVEVQIHGKGSIQFNYHISHGFYQKYLACNLMDFSKRELNNIKKVANKEFFDYTGLILE